MRATTLAISPSSFSKSFSPYHALEIFGKGEQTNNLWSTARMASCAVAAYRLFQHLADETLIGNTGFGRGGAHRFEQLRRQAHVDPFGFGLKLETDRTHRGQVVFG